MQLSGLQEAIGKAGGQVALAEHLGVTQQAISAWLLRGWAPDERVPQIADFTGVEKRRLCDPRLIDLLG